MADYYTIQQSAQKLGIAEVSITELEVKGLLQPTVKDGRRFFSSRQVYHLRAALRLARKEKIGLEEAFARVADRWLAHISVRGN